LIETIFKVPVMEEDPGLIVLDQKIRRVKCKENGVVKGKFSNG
jgi:hypothetical protein